MLATYNGDATELLGPLNNWDLRSANRHILDSRQKQSFPCKLFFLKLRANQTSSSNRYYNNEQTENNVASLCVVGGQQLLFTFWVEVAPWTLINAACFIFPKKWDKTFWKMQDNVLTANLLSQASRVFVTFILKEYDFVFDVEIQEGSPRLKLPYNLTGMRYYYIVLYYIIILFRCTKLSFRAR